MNKGLLLFAATALVLTACSNDKITSESAPEVEIRLSSSLDVMTRATYSPTQATAIVDDEIVYAWVDNPDDTQKYGAWKLKASSSNLDSYTSGEKKYYPATSTGEVNIYALHGNLTFTGGDAYPTSAVSHSVETDQQTAGNYEESDLLYAKATGLTRTSSRQSLTFYHILSKVEVGLVPGEGAPDLTDATIEILGTYPTANVTFTKATAANAYTATEIAVDNSGSTAAITMRRAQDASGVMTTGASSTETNVKVFGEAIIIPQTITASTSIPTNFIKLTLKDGGVLYAKLTANQTFAPYKKYIYKVTVGLTELTLKSTIVDWTIDGTVNDTPAEW